MKLVTAPFASLAMPKMLGLFGGNVVALSEADGTLVFLDPVTLARVNALDLGHDPQPTCLATRNKQIFVGCWKARTIAVIGSQDESELKVLRVLHMPDGVTGLTTFKNLIIGAQYGGGVFFLDTASPAWLEGIFERDWRRALQTVQTPTDAWAPAVHYESGLVFVPHGGGQVVKVLHAETRELVFDLTVPSRPGVAFHSVFVSQEEGLAHAIYSNPGDNQPARHIATFDMHGKFRGARHYPWNHDGRGQTVMMPGGDSIIACVASQEVVRLDWSGNQVDQVDIDGEPYGLALSPDGILYVGIKHADMVCKIEL